MTGKASSTGYPPPGQKIKKKIKKHPGDGRRRTCSEAPLSNPSRVTGGVGSRLPGGAEIKSTFTLLEIKQHPEQRGGF